MDLPTSRVVFRTERAHSLFVWFRSVFASGILCLQLRAGKTVRTVAILQTR